MILAMKQGVSLLSLFSLMAWLLLQAPAMAQETAGTNAHPANILSDYLLRPYLNPTYWEEKMEQAEKQSPQHYPCESKTLPLVRQYMLYHTMRALQSPQFRYKLATTLTKKMDLLGLNEVNHYYANGQAQSETFLTYTQDKQMRIKTNIATAKAQVARAIQSVERDVLRATKKELPKIITAYSNPDGSCKSAP